VCQDGEGEDKEKVEEEAECRECAKDQGAKLKDIHISEFASEKDRARLNGSATDLISLNLS